MNLWQRIKELKNLGYIFEHEDISGTNRYGNHWEGTEYWLSILQPLDAGKAQG